MSSQTSTGNITRPLGSLRRVRLRGHLTALGAIHVRQRAKRRAVGNAHGATWLRRAWLWFSRYANSIAAVSSVVTMISLLYGVFTYTVLEAGPRREAELKTEIAAAWQTLNSGLGQGGNAGRIDALETLNRYNISLAGVTVTDAFLFRLNLPGADLERANFKGADLRSVVFEGAYLMEANFEGAILLAANFKDARLSGANFRGAMMEYSNLENAKIDRADLRGAWVGASNFQGTVLFQTCVEGVSFADARNLTSEQVSETVGISTPCRPVPSP